MLYELSVVLTDVIILLLCVSVAFAFFHWRKLPKAFHYLTYFLCWNLFIEALVSVLTPDYMSNNLPLLHLYTLFEFILLSLLYWKMGLFEKWPKRRFWVFLGLMSLLIVLNSALLQSIFAYNTYAKNLVQVVLIIYAVAYMFQLRPKQPASAALNLVNATLLISYSGSLFIFMFGNVLMAEQFGTLFWEVNVFLNLLFQLLILISLWKASRARKLAF
jgi:hypothetical protein